jgi:hypothetical protein
LDFAEAWIGPPNDFSGAVDITAELHLPDESIADRRRLRLEWSAPTAASPEGTATVLELAALASPADQGGPHLIDDPAKVLGRIQVAAPSVPVEAATTLMPVLAEPDVMVRGANVSPLPRQVAPTVGVASAHPSISAQGVADLAASSAMPRSPQLDPEQIEVLVERGKHFIASGDLVAARIVLRRASESRDASAAFALGSTYDPAVLRDLKAYGVAPDLELARGWYEKAKEFGSGEAQRRIQILAKPGS